MGVCVPSVRTGCGRVPMWEGGVCASNCHVWCVCVSCVGCFGDPGVFLVWGGAFQGLSFEEVISWAIFLFVRNAVISLMF